MFWKMFSYDNKKIVLFIAYVFLYSSFLLFYVFLPEKISQSLLLARDFFILAFTVLLALSIVYLYLPPINHYRSAECHVISCVDVTIECCKPFFSISYCVSHSYTNLTFMLEINNETVYTRSETHICDGPIGQDDWVYHQMCQDSNLKRKMPCFYDETDIPNSLHLSNAFQTLPPLGIASITFCVIMLVSWIFYLIFYCVKYRRAY